MFMPIDSNLSRYVHTLWTKRQGRLLKFGLVDLA